MDSCFWCCFLWCLIGCVFCAYSYEVLEEDSERMNLPVYFRERHAKHSGASSGTMLFGQPLLINVLRHNLTVDTLYERVLERIGSVVVCQNVVLLFHIWLTFIFVVLGVMLSVHREPLQTVGRRRQPQPPLLAAANHQNASLRCPAQH